jgi:hypothetical protein
MSSLSTIARVRLRPKGRRSLNVNEPDIHSR